MEQKGQKLNSLYEGLCAVTQRTVVIPPDGGSILHAGPSSFIPPLHCSAALASSSTGPEPDPFFHFNSLAS